jgi:transcriptional regulator with XRE-family HTH domain
MECTVSNVMESALLEFVQIRIIIDGMSFAARLKWARKRAGVSQQQIADQCGLSNRTISALERGTAAGILGNNLYCVSDFIRVNPRWLVTGLGSPDDADSLGAEIEKMPPEQQEVIRRMIEAMRR